MQFNHSSISSTSHSSSISMSIVVIGVITFSSSLITCSMYSLITSLHQCDLWFPQIISTSVLWEQFGWFPWCAYSSLLQFNITVHFVAFLECFEELNETGVWGSDCIRGCSGSPRGAIQAHGNYLCHTNTLVTVVVNKCPFMCSCHAFCGGIQMHDTLWPTSMHKTSNQMLSSVVQYHHPLFPKVQHLP